MEELKLLVEMVANLPSMALWVIAFFFAYKVSIIGSIYWVIRLAIQRAYELGIAKKTMPTITQEINLKDKCAGICIRDDETLNLLLLQLQRVKGKRVGISSSFIHECSVDWLREAITEKEDREREVSK
jgi:hypothetical protein